MRVLMFFVRYDYSIFSFPYTNITLLFTFFRGTCLPETVNIRPFSCVLCTTIGAVNHNRCANCLFTHGGKWAGRHIFQPWGGARREGKGKCFCFLKTHRSDLLCFSFLFLFWFWFCVMGLFVLFLLNEFWCLRG